MLQQLTSSQSLTRSRHKLQRLVAHSSLRAKRRSCRSQWYVRATSEGSATAQYTGGGGYAGVQYARGGAAAAELYSRKNQPDLLLLVCPICFLAT